MNSEKLNELVTQQRSGVCIEERQILDEIAKLMIENPRLFGVRREDEIGEVFAKYLPRLKNLSKRYNDTGSCFSAFLVSSIRYMVLSVRQEWQQDYDIENVGIEMIKQDLLHKKDIFEPNYDGISLDKSSIKNWKNKNVLKKRIVFLCLKCANVIDDEMVKAIANELELNENKLLTLVTIARMKENKIRFSNNYKISDSLWLKINAEKLKLSKEYDPDLRKILKEQITKYETQYRKSSNRKRKIKIILSNKSVAEICGVSCACVNGGLDSLYKYYKKVEKLN